MKEKSEKLKTIKKESEEELQLFRKTQTDRLDKEITALES